MAPFHTLDFRYTTHRATQDQKALTTAMSWNSQIMHASAHKYSLMERNTAKPSAVLEYGVAQHLLVVKCMSYLHELLQ
jgi:hypothetical protein